MLPLLVAVTASAQNNDGFALDRYDPSERGSDWFANESLDLRGDKRPALGLVLDWGFKPLVMYESEDGDEDRSIVRHQVFGHLGGGVILWDRVRFAASMPVLLFGSGNGVTTPAGTFAIDEGVNAGDLRLGADVRLFGEYQKPVTMALGLRGHLPTGSRDAYAGDGSVRVEPRAMVAGDIASFTYAARAGVLIRGNGDDYAGVPFGSEMSFGAAAGLRLLEKKLTVGPEIYGTTGISDSDAFFGRRTTPFELIFGGKYAVGSGVRLGAGVGPGLTRGLGSPALRVLAAVEWMPDIEPPPPPPPPDRDKDGILDANDACPDQPGPANDDPAKNGCPPPPDRDGDGILDPTDACPDQPGPASDDPAKNGCPPPPDRDQDGIIDEKDACPDQPGPANDDPTKNGCPPPPDTDGDGIIDPQDACPNEPGEANVDPARNGCPRALVDKATQQIKILERIEFDTNKATIRPESDAVLTAVRDIMVKETGITQVRIEGHTDNRGGRWYNRQLSDRRAKSVKDWLVKNGVDAGRLVTQGLGPDKPIAENDTDQGRQTNRRVEFHIVSQSGASDASTSGPSPATPTSP